MPNSSLNSGDLPPPLENQLLVQDLDFDNFRLDGQPNGLVCFEDVFGDLDNDPIALQQLLSNYNENPSDAHDSGSADFFESLTGLVFEPVENPLLSTTEIEDGPVYQCIHACADIENLLLPTTDDPVHHPIHAANIEIPFFPTIEIEHGPSQQSIQTACANDQPLLPTIESEHDPIQYRIQNACVTTQDPTDFFFKSFVHPKNDMKRMAITEPRNLIHKKRKTSEEKQYNLCSAKEESGVGNEDLEKIKAWGGMKLVAEPPKELIADARSLGIRSVLPLFRKPTEAAENSTRKPVAKQLLSMQISAEWYLQIQAAAKEYMLDIKYPKRMAAVGLKTRAGADSSDLFNCCMEFLEQQWGENCWGIMADFYEGRTLLWPKDKIKITNRVMPLLRRVVTNERQRLYAAEKRKEQKDGNLGECSQTTTNRHLNTPNTPILKTPITSNMPSTPNTLFVPNTTITSPSQQFLKGHQARIIDKSELRSRVLESPSPFPDDTNMGQYRYSSTSERNPDTSRRTSTSSKTSGTSGNESDYSLATRTETSSETEASMIYPIQDTILFDGPTIKFHINFLQCGRRVREGVEMNVTTQITFSSFIQNIRSIIAGDLMTLKNIQVLCSERLVDINNPGVWNMVLAEVVKSAEMDFEAKVMVEVEEDLFGEEREVSPFVTLL